MNCTRCNKKVPKHEIYTEFYHCVPCCADFLIPDYVCPKCGTELEDYEGSLFCDVCKLR